jgi:hypothetical protein
MEKNIESMLLEVSKASHWEATKANSPAKEAPTAAEHYRLHQHLTCNSPLSPPQQRHKINSTLAFDNSCTSKNDLWITKHYSCTNTHRRSRQVLFIMSLCAYVFLIIYKIWQSITKYAIIWIPRQYSFIAPLISHFDKRCIRSNYQNLVSEMKDRKRTSDQAIGSHQ